MRVAIRVDASAAIGTGHVRRCQSLAEALGRCGAEVRFVMRDLGLPVVGDTLVLRAPGAPTEADPAIPHSAWLEVAQDRDADETAATLADWRPDWLVVDSYAIDARWHRAVRAALGCRIAVIDDLADRALAADILIDHNFAPDHRIKYAAVAPGTRLLGGPRYALLGPVYAGARRYAFSERIGSIGVFLGGIDAAGTNLRVLDAIAVSGWSGPVEVVTTSANPDLGALERAIARHPLTTLSRDLPNLAEFFARHDLQIGAGGGAIWERCCIGAPTVCLIVAENQRLSVPFLDAAGIVVGHDMLGDVARATGELAQCIAEIMANPLRRLTLSARSTELVDGHGAARVAAEIVERRN